MAAVDSEKLNRVLSENGYVYIKKLGDGAFSSVFLCESVQYHHLFAIKQVSKQKLAQQEINSLISLIHPYIVKLYSTFHDEDNQYLVMEYCQNGTLKNKNSVEYERFVHYAKEILEVLEYCHSQKIAHRDIKPENIFVDQYDNIKLGDFGLSNKFDVDESAHNKCGSLIYCSPEILNKTDFDPFKADIWSLGITFFYLVTGKLPYPDCTAKKLKDIIIYGQIDFDSYNIVPPIQFLIMKMTSKNPNTRPSAHHLLQLPIFTPNHQTKIRKSISISTFHSKSGSILTQKSLLCCGNSSDTFLNTNFSDTLSSDCNHSDEQSNKTPKKILKIHSFYQINQNQHKHFVKFD